MTNYEWFCSLKPNSLILEMNEHACNYVTATEWIECHGNDEFLQVPDEVVRAIKETNTMWRLQIYPDTPNGFNVWYGATLDSVISQARASINAAGTPHGN